MPHRVLRAALLFSILFNSFPAPATGPLPAQRLQTVHPSIRDQAIVQTTVAAVRPFVTTARIYLGHQAIRFETSPWISMVPALKDSLISHAFALLIPLSITVWGMFSLNPEDPKPLQDMKQLAAGAIDPNYIGRVLATQYFLSTGQVVTDLERSAHRFAFLRWLRNEIEGPYTSPEDRDRLRKLDFACRKWMMVYEIPYSEEIRTPALLRAQYLETLQRLDSEGTLNDLRDVMAWTLNPWLLTATVDILQQRRALEPKDIEFLTSKIGFALRPAKTDSPADPLRTICYALAMLRRLGDFPQINNYRESAPIRQSLRQQLGYSSLSNDEIRHVFDLLTGNFNARSAEAITFFHRLKAHGPPTNDMQVMVWMLSMLEVTGQHPYFGTRDPSFESQDSPFVGQFFPHRIDQAWREITRTPWLAEDSQLRGVPEIAERFGLLLNRGMADAAIDRFLALLFKPAFLEILNEGTKQATSISAGHFNDFLLAAARDDARMRNPNIAATTQMAALTRSGLAVDAHWPFLYQQAFFGARDGLSLSEIARDLLSQTASDMGLAADTAAPARKAALLGGYLPARSREEDAAKRQWRVFLPRQVFSRRMLAELAKPPFIILTSTSLKPESWSLEVLLARLVENFSAMIDPGNFTATKDLGFYHDHWDLFEKAVRGEDIGITLPRYGEVHFTNDCELDCVQCRGGIRGIEGGDFYIATQVLKDLFDSWHRLNPQMQVRISGEIGDPTRHPQIADVLEYLVGKLAWGMTTNGIGISKPRVMDLLLEALFTGISLDVWSHELYATLKQHVTNPEDVPNLYELVRKNIRDLIKRRERSKSLMKVYVSFLLITSQTKGLVKTIQELRDEGVDGVQFKMKHHDPKWNLKPGEVQHIYEVLQEVYELRRPDFAVTILQPLTTALRKVLGTTGAVLAETCYTNLFGHTTVRPKSRNGNAVLETCCNYGNGRTLGSQGVTDGKDFEKIWRSQNRKNVLKQRADQICAECPPSDERVITTAHWAHLAHQRDPSILHALHHLVDQLYEFDQERRRLENERMRQKRGIVLPSIILAAFLMIHGFLPARASAHPLHLAA